MEVCAKSVYRLLASKGLIHFTNIGSNLAEIFYRVRKHLRITWSSWSETASSISILLTDENEVKLIVRELSPNTGQDDILPKVVKAVINSIAPQLVNIFNNHYHVAYFVTNSKWQKSI